VASHRIKQAGLAGAGVAGAVASGVAVWRAVARRSQRTPDTKATDPFQMPAGVREHDILTADGASIHLVEQGPAAGPLVLLLHGITLSSAVWHYQLRDLSAAGYRVVAIDFRGHGRSVAGSEGLTIDRLAADVEEVMAALGTAPLLLVGHSMGGMVALRMLARDPLSARGAGQVGALVLVATSASPVRHRGLPLARGLVAAARPLLMRGAALSARLPGPALPADELGFPLARLSFGKDAAPAEVSFVGELTAGVPARVSVPLLLEIIRFDEERSLASIRLPTTVIVGDRDVLIPVAHGRALAAAIPGARLLELDGCGHMVMLERRREMDDVLRASTPGSREGTGMKQAAVSVAGAPTAGAAVSVAGAATAGAAVSVAGAAAAGAALEGAATGGAASAGDQ